MIRIGFLNVYNFKGLSIKKKKMYYYYFLRITINHNKQQYWLDNYNNNGNTIVLHNIFYMINEKFLINLVLFFN